VLVVRGRSDVGGLKSKEILSLGCSFLTLRGVSVVPPEIELVSHDRPNFELLSNIIVSGYLNIFQ
jgi:hypothetical protein